jgi:hypothetical protein
LAPPSPARAHSATCSSAELRAGLAQLELLLDNLAIKGEGLRFAANGLGGPGAIATPELT